MTWRETNCFCFITKQIATNKKIRKGNLVCCVIYATHSFNAFKLYLRVFCLSGTRPHETNVLTAVGIIVCVRTLEVDICTVNLAKVWCNLLAFYVVLPWWSFVGSMLLFYKKKKSPPISVNRRENLKGGWADLTLPIYR